MGCCCTKILWRNTDWTQDELKCIDRKTRKLITINRALHPRANASRLYLPRNEGGRGLRSVEETVRTEDYGLAAGVKRKEVIVC